MAVSFFDRTTFAVLAPTIMAKLDISRTAYGWLAAAFSISYLLATPLSGWWIDRIGARRGLVSSVLLWTTVAALHALVPNFAVLFMLRIALGIAEGPTFPGSAQTVQRILPVADRPRAFGVLFTGSSIGAMLAPPITSALYKAGGWRVALLSTALIGLIWFPVWMYWTTRPGVREQLDRGAEPQAVVARAPAREVLKHPALIRGMLAIFAVAPIFGMALQWGSDYLNKTFGVKQEDVGHYLWLPPIAFDGAAILFGHLASRQRRESGESPRLLLMIGMVLGTTLAALPWVSTPWQAVGIVAIAAAGGGIVYTLATADMLARMPQQNVSLAAGTMAGAQALSLIISSPLIGRSVDHFHSYDVAAIAVGLWVLPGCLAWLLWRPR